MFFYTSKISDFFVRRSTKLTVLFPSTFHQLKVGDREVVKTILPNEVWEDFDVSDDGGRHSQIMTDPVETRGLIYTLRGPRLLVGSVGRTGGS